MRYKTINLKKDSPTVALALAMLEIELEVAKHEGVSAVKVIHGYGSHGVGGEIKKALSHWLVLNKNRGVISEFVKGEEWPSSPKSEKIKKLCAEVLGDSELFYPNPGITIILI